MLPLKVLKSSGLNENPSGTLETKGNWSNPSFSRYNGGFYHWRWELVEQEEIKKEQIMTTENVLSSVLDSNQVAAVTAAKLNAAKIALETLQKIAKKNLPEELAAYADSSIGLLVIANVVNQLVPHVTDNNLAHEMANNALVAAYQEVVNKFGIQNIVQQFVGAVSSNFLGASND